MNCNNVIDSNGDRSRYGPDVSQSRANSVHSHPAPLTPLRTILEVKAVDTTIDVCITAVPVRSANSALNILRNLLPDHDGVDLQHLRRFAKYGDLPQQLRKAFKSTDSNIPDTAQKPTSLFLLVGPIGAISPEELQEYLITTLPTGMGESLVFWKTSVPLLAPTSEEQAISWSQSHWPTIYKRCNPFGPHPSIISRSEIEILPELSKWMAMARAVAASCKSKGIGEEIGAVVVDNHGTVPHALALAADARWAGRENGTTGNVMAHAVLRAIGMVAQKLRTVDRVMGNVCESELEPQELHVFMDTPLLPEEAIVFDNSSMSRDGYLCHNLDIYLTHEPCIMCSMALLHSRFRRVVIGARMPKTGGLCSEAGNNLPDNSESEGLGYGLFWRKELNWNMLAWETEVPVSHESESLRSSIIHI